MIKWKINKVNNWEGKIRYSPDFYGYSVYFNWSDLNRMLYCLTDINNKSLDSTRTGYLNLYDYQEND